jgi:YVTN family beta-propeller protein/autotransporter-associated beta strand protein
MILDRLPRCKTRHGLRGRSWTVDGTFAARVWTKRCSANGGLTVQPPRNGERPCSSKLKLSLLASVWLGGIAMLAPDVVRAQQGPFLYVPNASDNNVSVLDTPTNSTVPPTIPVGSGPFAAGVRGDQALVYVTNINGNNVSVIDTSNNAVVATVGVGVNPFVAAVSPNGAFVYVSNNGASSVSVINAATNTVSATVTVGAAPAGLAISPDGTRVYVANFSSNTVSVIDTATNTVIGAPIPVGNNPTGMAIAPDGSRAYVTNTSSNSISVINTATNTVIGVPIAVGSNPDAVAVSPNGTRIYVTNFNSNTVSVINAATNTVVATIPVGSGPEGVVFSPDGTRAYVANSNNNTVSVIDTTTNSTIDTAAVGALPIFPGICSNGNALLAAGLTFTARTSGALACTLASGASGSFGPVFTGGTLQLAGANISSALPITLQAAGGTFDTNGNTATLSGVISGPGALTKIGAGVLTLSGINTYTGTTTLNAGALIVNGSIASSSLTTVNSGAALLGGGTVGSTVVNARGFLVPGPVGTPGTMTVAGNLAFQSGAFYVVQVNPTTASTTNVSGTASLAGIVGAIFLPGSYLPRSYTILMAAGGRTGTFDGLATFGLPPDFGRSLSYTGNTAVLNLTARLVPEPTPTPAAPLIPPIPGLPTGPEDPPDPPLPPFTVNQLNVGHAIDNFFNNGGALPPAFVPLFGLTGSNLTNALSQLSGEAATGAQKVGFQLTDQFLNMMLDPFVDGRSGVGGADHSALGFAPEREAMPPDIAHTYAAALKAPPKAVPIYEPRLTAWGGAYGGSNRTSGDLAVIGSHDLSASTVGFAGGLDYRLTPDTVVGFALAGGGTNWSLSEGLGGGKSDAFQAGIYGATRFGPAYLAAAFAFANHWMSTDRFAVGDHLTANFNAQSYGGRLEGGYRFATPYGGITPYAAIQGQSFHTPGYTETDAVANGFALAFGPRDATDSRSELGARFDRVLAVYSNAVLALRGRLAWAHDWVSDPTLVPVFQALPGASFIVNGATLAKNSALTSAGAELRLANGITLLAKFDGEVASHSSTYAGTGTVRYTW